MLALSTPGLATGDEVSRQVYERTMRATAQVIVPAGNGASLGTGWMLSTAPRLLVTNYHVVAPRGKLAARVLVVFPKYLQGRVVAEPDEYQEAPRIHGKVVATDSGRDLALVEVALLPAGVVALQLAADSPAPGDRIHSIGARPGASQAMWVYTQGTVRQVCQARFRLNTGQEISARQIETQSPTNPGDSGGPAVNDQGDLVGVDSSQNTKARLISYLIDVHEVRRFAQERGVRLPGAGD
jgi:S1-C subfamily serine protease